MISNRILTLCLNPSIDSILSVNTILLYSKNILEGSRLFYGGKGINVAYALGKLGTNVIATGFIGREDEEAFSRKLSAVGAETCLLAVNGQTRKTYKIVEGARGKDTEFNEKGFTVTAEDQTELIALLDRLLNDAGWLVLTGSLPPGLPESFYKTLILKARTHKLIICLDASGVTLREGAQARPDVLRINRSELEELVGIELPDVQSISWAIKETAQKGIRNVVVSLGAEGVLASDDGRIIRVRTPKVEVKSLTGAGDTMIAGIVYQLSRGIEFQESVRFGAALATASVLRFEPGDFDPEDLRRILQNTVVEQIN